MFSLLRNADVQSGPFAALKQQMSIKAERWLTAVSVASNSDLAPYLTQPVNPLHNGTEPSRCKYHGELHQLEHRLPCDWNTDVRLLQ